MFRISFVEGIEKVWLSYEEVKERYRGNMRLAQYLLHKFFGIDYEAVVVGCAD